jgi:DNA-binding transcriptional regulator GbsR (MarR family)
LTKKDLTKNLKEKKHNSVGYRKMPFNALKDFFADFFVEEYKKRFDDQDDSHKEMLEMMKDYIQGGDSSLLQAWIEEEMDKYLGTCPVMKRFKEDFVNDVHENMDGYRGIARTMGENFHSKYCPDHGIPWDRPSNSPKAICSECEKKEEEEAKERVPLD